MSPYASGSDRTLPGSFLKSDRRVVDPGTQALEGLVFQGEGKSPAAVEQRGGCLGRTVGLAIPCQVASQIPTPFYQAG